MERASQMAATKPRGKPLTSPGNRRDGSKDAPSLPFAKQGEEDATLVRQILLRREPRLKRPLDLALSASMLAATSPIWLVIAAAIKIEDRGPVFYRQRRWGRAALTFDVYKFRTMRVLEPDGAVRQASDGDARITRVGRFLRATGMDELPQLLSIFRGEMSFVGPRALAVGERDADGRPLSYEHLPGFAVRLSVRPGLTGLATISLPKDASVRSKFGVDALYVRRQSFWLDLRLIVLSFVISFRGKWETRGKKV